MPYILHFLSNGYLPMSKAVSDWLKDLGLGQYDAMFRDHDIDWDLLNDIDQQTLKDMGVESAGHRLRLLKAIKALEIQPLSTEADDPGSMASRDDELAGWSRTPGERKPVTMLFADIVNSTALTEKLDAEEAHDLLYLAIQRMCKAVEENRGTICRFMGDGIMAMFGAPLSSEWHALEACQAALEMQRAIQDYATELEDRHGIGLQARVGLNSGEVVVLEVGDDPEKPEYDASGPTVPLAARMEQSAEVGTILITDSTRALAGDFVGVERLDAISVKGVSVPVPIYRLIEVLSALEVTDRTTRQPFVGRKIELAQFDSLLDICLGSGYGKAVYIRGEAGIGKTRLVEEISQVASHRGLRRHKTLVLDFGAGKGQEAIPSLIRSLLGIAPGSNKDSRERALAQAESDSIADLEQRVFLNDLLDLPQPLALRTVYDAMSAESRSNGKRTALVGILRNLAARKPLLVVVEDLHWADEITLEYLSSLAAAVAECASFLVMTSRIEGDPLGKSWRAQIGENPIVTWDLGPLRLDESVSLVSGFIDVGDDLAQKCIERAAGNPLFLEQLLISVQKGASEQVPDSIKALVLARMDQLPDEDKQALQAAAVLGQRFELDALRFLLDNAGFECRNLIEHQLVRPEQSMFLFAHALIQEGSYTSLVKRQRVELHQRAAEWYRHRDLILYAEHLDQAGDSGTARAYLDAARQQADQYRPKRALQLVERGLEIAPSTDGYELRILQASLLHVLGRVSKSIEAYAEARTAARDDIDRCRALVGMAQGMAVTDAHAEIALILEEADAMAQNNRLNYERAQICHIRGGVYFFESDIEACIEINREGLKFARKADSPDVIALALSGLGDAEYCRGYVNSALTYFEECMSLAHKHGIGRIIAANLTMKALILAWQNDFERALKAHDEAYELAVKTHNLRAEMINLVSGGYIWLSRGDLARAQDSTERCVKLSRHLGSGLIEGTALGYLARVKYYQGHPEEACRIAMQSVDILRQTDAGMTFRAPASLGVLAMATQDENMRRESWREAEALLAAGSISHNYYNFYEDAIETCLNTQDWEAVDRFATALESYNSAEPLARCTYMAARGHALAALGRGQRDSKTIAELTRLYEYGKETGLKLSLPALETALASVG